MHAGSIPAISTKRNLLSILDIAVLLARLYNRTTMLEEAKKAIRTRTLGYIAGGLGLVAGLAWNDAIRSLIDQLLPSNSGSIFAKLLYALVVTTVVAVLISYIERLSSK